MLTALAVLLLGSVPALAQLDTFRGTMPGSLHQCEQTDFTFFQSGNERPLTVVLLPSDNVDDSLRSGTLALSDMSSYNPLQTISGIDALDNTQYDFELKVANGEVFEVFGFLPDGQGKALSLTRTVTTALPAATNCNPATAVPLGAGVCVSAEVAKEIADVLRSVTQARQPTRSTTSTASSASATSNSAVTVTVTVYPPGYPSGVSASASASSSGTASGSASASRITGAPAVTQCVQQCASSCAAALSLSSGAPSATPRLRRRHF